VADVLGGLLVVDGEVAGDSEEPGDERYAAVLVARYGLEGVEEGLFGEIFGEKGVAGEEEGVLEDSGSVAFVEAAKRVAFACGGERDKFLFLIGLCEDRPTHKPLLLVGSDARFAASWS
jgi:hypothetical protein